MELRATRELRRNARMEQTAPKKGEGSPEGAKAPAKEAPKQPADQLSLSQQALAYAEEQRQKLFSRIQRVVLEKAGALKVDHITDYLRFYQGEKAVRHLFLVAAGLDSMVVGEDQILGQVKKAHGQAREAGTTGKYLNTLFRYAVTCAKRIKTDTELYKTSVSSANLAV